MANLFAAYQSLPESIQKWLSDENVVLIISEINQKLSLAIDDERAEIIPHLILRLCVQDLEPRNFINELSHELNISFDSAKILTQEIEERILKPIEAPLKIDVGVDLKLLYFANPTLRPSGFAEQAKNITETLPSQNLTSKISQPETPNTQHPTSNIQEKPFILHNEEPTIPQTLRGASGQATQPSFSYKIPISQTPAQPAPPPKAQIQAPSPSIQRVVHYSSFFTKLFSPEVKKAEQSKIKVPGSKWFI